MVTPTPGTIPALTPYQPAALPITGQELVEIASSNNPATAISGSMLITDLVGKAPTAMPSASPTLGSLIAFFDSATQRPASCSIIQLSAAIPPAGVSSFNTRTGAITLLNNDLPLFSSSLEGAVPASGGGTTNFLRSDGSWVSPGGSGSPGGVDTQVQFNNSSAFGADSGFTYAAGTGNATLSGKLLSGTLQVNATDPNVNNDTSDIAAARFNVTYDQLMSDPGFTDENGVEIVLNYTAGLNQFGGGTNAKITPIALDISSVFNGAGERFGLSNSANFYGMGDAFLFTGQMNFASGPIDGDEGVGFSPAYFCAQQNFLALDTIASVAQTTLSTTCTGTVTASQTAQVIPVASTAGANVNDWVVFNQVPYSGSGGPSGFENIWAGQITAVNPGVSITAICAINLAPGSSITPAMVITGTFGFAQFGQNRVVVNLQGTSYSVGTASQQSPISKTLLGTGTTWANNMVGGDINNIGAISFDADVYDDALGPFHNGYTIPLNGNSSLRSWYQIQAVNSTTSLDIASMSVAGVQAYIGNAPVSPLSGGYIVRPAARVLQVIRSGGGTIVCETTNSTWSAGNQIECIICPYPDFHGWDFRLAQYTTGGIRRQMFGLINFGARAFGQGISLGGGFGGTTGRSGSDPYSFGVAIQASDFQQGLFLLCGPATTNGIRVDSTQTSPTGVNANIRFVSTGADTQIGNDDTDAGMYLGGSNVSGLGWPLVSGVQDIPNITGLRQVTVGGGLEIWAANPRLPILRFARNFLIADQSIDIRYELVTSSQLQFIYNDISGTGLSFIPFFVGKPVDNATYPAAGQDAQHTATSDVTNAASNIFAQSASVWDGAAAQSRNSSVVVVPAQGSNNAQLTTYIALMGNNPIFGIGYDVTKPNFALGIREDGLFSFGYRWASGANPFTSMSDQALYMDAITNLTTTRTVTFPDTSGDVLVAATNTTGGGTALLSTNSPAVTNTAPYTWLQMKSHDGSTVYVPAWK